MTLVAPHRLVEDLEGRLRDLEIDFHRAYWDSQIEATPEREQRRIDLELELRRAKGDPAAFAAVGEALEDPIHEPVLRRSLEVLRLTLWANQMDDAQRERLVELSSSIESDFAAFRPKVDGRKLNDNDIEQILKQSDDEDTRRRAWEASKEVGGVIADRLRDLARVRNSIARDLGFADYYTMSLELQELPENWLFEVMDEVESLTEEPFREWKSTLDSKLKERFRTETVYPWHYSDPFFQGLPPDATISLDHLFNRASAEQLAVETFRRWDLDISGVMSVSDLYPRDLKSQHAFCLDVDRSGTDVRILANIVPGERWVEVMLHESGHAAFDISIDSRLPYMLRRPAHTFVTEAIALLSGRLARDSSWLSQVVGMSSDEVDEVAPALRAATNTQSLLFARWVLVMVNFERDFYLDPEADLDVKWWEYVSRFQLVEPPPRRSHPDWAAKIHVAAAPVYYHNYLLGDLLASQIRSRIEADCGGFVGRSEAGAWLRERIFRPGNLVRWDALIEAATGAPLSAADFAADVSATTA